jgi:iron-sulfur cluster assembly accessory protein
MDDPVAVTLEWRAGGRWRLIKVASPAVFEAGREHGSLFHRAIRSYVVSMSTVTVPDVTLSASAAKRINAILAKQDGVEFLRVSVEGGGCSGFSYKFDFAEAVNADDLVVERDGAHVLIDEMSLEFLRGAEIDFSTELIGAAFKINNPNATAACGCGTSFSV